MAKLDCRNAVVHLDNRYVFPYKQHLLQKYNCYINVKYAASIASISYLFKYVQKDFNYLDLYFRQQYEFDKIRHYTNNRYVAAPKAC